MNPLSDIRITDLSPDLHADLVQLQFESWSKTYRNVLPASFVENDLFSLLQRHWSEAFKDGSGLVCRGAFQGKVLVGFASLYMNRDIGAFLDNLHVRPGLTSRGVGSRMMKDCFRVASEHGKSRLYLWVLDENHRAIAFYRRHGGVETGSESQDHFGQPLNAIKIEFPVSCTP